MKIGMGFGVVVLLLMVASKTDAQSRLYPNATSAYRYGNASGPDWGNGYAPAPVHRNSFSGTNRGMNPPSYSFGSGSTGMFYDRGYGSNWSGAAPNTRQNEPRWNYSPPVINYGPYRPYGYGFGYGYRGW
jgi:hypothetical protein